jgi:hypothetical protein
MFALIHTAKAVGFPAHFRNICDICSLCDGGGRVTKKISKAFNKGAMDTISDLGFSEPVKEKNENCSKGSYELAVWEGRYEATLINWVSGIKEYKIECVDCGASQTFQIYTDPSTGETKLFIIKSIHQC